MPSKKSGGARRTEAKKKVAKDGEKQFRFNAKKLGLTYSCPENREDNPIPSCEYIRDAIVDTYGHALWTICEEKHENGKSHYHAHFVFDKKLDVANPRAFDLQGVHPNILVAGSGWENYVRKHGNFITNRNPDSYAKARDAESCEAALQILWQEKPGDMMRYGESIERNLRRRFHKPPTYEPYLGPFPDWPAWDHTRHSLLVWGPPGGGKTQFCRWLMGHMFGEYLFVKKCHEQFKQVDQWKPFLFDEVYLIEKEQELSREITDVEAGGSLHCRNSNCTIPPQIPRVFTSNYEHPFRNPQSAVYGRRVVSVHYNHGLCAAPTFEQEKAECMRREEARVAAEKARRVTVSDWRDTC